MYSVLSRSDFRRCMYKCSRALSCLATSCRDTTGTVLGARQGAVKLFLRLPEAHTRPTHCACVSIQVLPRRCATGHVRVRDTRTIVMSRSGFIGQMKTSHVRYRDVAGAGSPWGSY